MPQTFQEPSAAAGPPTAGPTGAVGVCRPPQRPQSGHRFGRLVINDASSLGEHSTQDTGLPEIAAVPAALNMQRCYHWTKGGQAEVWLCKWQNHPDWPTPIKDGTPIAIKKMLVPLSVSCVRRIESEKDLVTARETGLRGLRTEINILDTLHASGCGSRVIKPLGLIQFAGHWCAPDMQNQYFWEPVYAYLMPAYKLGSVRTLLAKICNRSVPGSVPQRLLNMRTLSSELATLLGELHKMHTTDGVCLMLQDVTSNNLLVNGASDGDDPLCLIFSDPALALPISMLEQPRQRHLLQATWLWGSMQMHSQIFDPKADLYGLCFIFAEMWLVAEGAVLPVFVTVTLLGMGSDRFQAVRFVRRLVMETLRTHHFGGTGHPPRVGRHLPVSWLGAWALLLGFRDFKHESQLGISKTFKCLRPAEEQMLEVVHIWARVAAAAEELPLDLTLDQAQSAACAPLVADMQALMVWLVGLSHLDIIEQQDPCLDWLAANFRMQQHPLVLAMNIQPGDGWGVPEAPKAHARLHADRRWCDVVQAAQRAVGSASARVEPRQVVSNHPEEVTGKLGATLLGVHDLVPPAHPPAHTGVPPAAAQRRAAALADPAAGGCASCAATIARQAAGSAGPPASVVVQQRAGSPLKRRLRAVSPTPSSDTVTQAVGAGGSSPTKRPRPCACSSTTSGAAAACVECLGTGQLKAAPAAALPSSLGSPPCHPAPQRSTGSAAPAPAEQSVYKHLVRPYADMLWELTNPLGWRPVVLHAINTSERQVHFVCWWAGDKSTQAAGLYYYKGMRKGTLRAVLANTALGSSYDNMAPNEQAVQENTLRRAARVLVAENGWEVGS